MDDLKIETPEIQPSGVVHNITIDADVSLRIKSIRKRGRDGRFSTIEVTKIAPEMQEVDALLARSEVLVKVETPRPPSSYFFEMLMPARQGADFIANLDELFERDCQRHGVGRARRLYAAQCFKAAVGHWFGVVLDAAERVRKVFPSQ